MTVQLPLKAGAKIITVGRHGEGWHNALSHDWVERGLDGLPYDLDHDPEFRLEDPELTPLGIEQAASLRATTQALDPQPELVVFSPLRRATMTALSAYEHLLGQVPFVAHEGCHEMAGKHTCDKRNSLAKLKGLFPMIDYSLIEHEEDPLWSLERETWEQVAARAASFMEWLWARPEKRIAVVAHGSFLITLLIAVLHLEGGIELVFETGTMRTLTVTAPEHRSSASTSQDQMRRRRSTYFGGSWMQCTTRAQDEYNWSQEEARSDVIPSTVPHLKRFRLPAFYASTQLARMQSWMLP